MNGTNQRTYILYMSQWQYPIQRKICCARWPLMPHSRISGSRDNKRMDKSICFAHCLGRKEIWTIACVCVCVDYRMLNRRTIHDHYTVLLIDDAIDCLAWSKWFLVTDLRSGYYQIPTAEEDKEKTTFTRSEGKPQKSTNQDSSKWSTEWKRLVWSCQRTLLVRPAG